MSGSHGEKYENVCFFYFSSCSLVETDLMREAGSISETSVNFYHTKRRSNPEGSHINTCSPLLTVNYSNELIIRYHAYLRIIIIKNRKIDMRT
jgi:hypothetical protein